MKLAAVILAGALCLAPAAALAGESFDQAVEAARRGMAAGDAKATLEALSQATAAAWQKLPFTAVNVNLTAAPPEGYGRYLTRVDNLYRPGEPLILYLEPVGFVVRFDPDNGSYTYKLTADFNLVDAWGMVVGGRRGFGQFGQETKHFPDRLPLFFTYSLAGLPPGDYRVETVLHDELGKKSHTVVTPIRVEGN